MDRNGELREFVSARGAALSRAAFLLTDTNADGTADYLVGIDNDAPERGDFHVWVTDLATRVRPSGRVASG